MGETVLTEEILTQMMAYVGIRDKTYDTVVILDANSPEPHKLYCFPVEDALRMIEMLGIVPVDGKVLLVDGKQGWGDVVKAIRGAHESIDKAQDKPNE